MLRMSDRFEGVIQEIELLLAESAWLQAKGVHCQIDHRFRKAGTICQAGEEVFAVWLIFRARPYQLKLPIALRVLFDYLARHATHAQSATQIETGMRSDGFYGRHGANASASRRLVRRISHSSVKTYIQRIRDAFRLTFDEARLTLDPAQVLVSERTVGNEVGYRLKATTMWRHV